MFCLSAERCCCVARQGPQLAVERRQREEFVGATWGPLRLAFAPTKH
jgi:hypothetical protein